MAAAGGPRIFIPNPEILDTRAGPRPPGEAPRFFLRPIEVKWEKSTFHQPAKRRIPPSNLYHHSRLKHLTAAGDPIGAEGGKPEAPSRPAALLEAALAAFFALGAAALFLAMPRLIAEGGIPSSQDFVTLSPIAFPRLTFGVLVFLGLFYLAPSVRQVAVARPTGEGFSVGKFWNVLAMAGWVILYAALVPWLGYGAATLLVTAGVTFFLGGRRWWQFLPIALLSPLAIRFIFERLLLISLPRGAFEPLAAAEDALLKLLTQLLFWG